MQKINCDLFEI